MPLRGVLSNVRRAVQFRRRPRPARAGSPRILVLGICQGEAVALAMQLLLPDAEVVFHSAFGLNRVFPRLSDLAAEAKGYDHVFSNSYLPAFRDGGTLADLRGELTVSLMPTVVFSAFHPDLVRVGQDGRVENGGLLGVLGHAHSALAVLGYLEGWDVDRTGRLFDEEVYRALGYLGLWDTSVEALRMLGREAAYDFDADLVRWSRRGCFMHTDNHPKMYVAADIARGVLARDGIPYADCDLDSFLADSLFAGGNWPVYPPIARLYGVPGNAMFLKVATRKTGPARTLSLHRYLAESFARYAAAPAGGLRCERVETWRADPAILSMLRDASA